MKRAFGLFCLILLLSGCATARLFRQASEAVSDGFFLDGVYTAAEVLDQKPNHRRAAALILENYTAALENGEALLSQADLSEEPTRTEERVRIYEKLVRVVSTAAGIGAQNVSFPDYTKDLSEARKNAVRLFLSYAEDAVDYRDTHSFGLKALGYAADDDKDAVRKQIAEFLYQKAAVMAASSAEADLLRALDCFTAVTEWVPSYADTSERILTVRTKLAEIYYAQAVDLSVGTSREQLKESLALFEKADGYVTGYKNSAAYIARLQERLTVRVFCYSPDWGGSGSYWRSSRFGYFNGTAVASEFRRELERRVRGNRYIDFPDYGLTAAVWNSGLYSVQTNIRDAGGDYLIVVTLTLPSDSGIRKRTQDRFRSYRVPSYRVAVEVDRNGVVSRASSATVSESAYNRLSSLTGNRAAFESALRREGVYLNTPSSGNWYYRTYTDSTSVQVTEREYVFEFELRGTAEVIDLWSDRTVYSARETKTVYGSAGTEYINLPSSLSHLRNPGFRPHYSIDEALSDSEVETVLSRLAAEIAVFLERQT